MFTFSTAVLRYLVDRGMFEEQALEVLKILKGKLQDSMDRRWDDDVSGYPPLVLNSVLLHVNSAAIEWIDKNLPLAWYRPMFTGELNEPSLEAQPDS